MEIDRDFPILTMKAVETEEFRRAIAEFNEGRYFECHDTLEALWVETRGEDRRFLQGLIQVSVGFYHFGNGNPSGALSQWGKGSAKLRQYPPGHAGIDVAGLLDAVGAWSEAAVRLLSGERAPTDGLQTPIVAVKLNSERRDQWQR